MKWPLVTRSRYERELKMLESAYAVRTDDLRSRLRALIEQVTHIRMSYRRDETEVAVRIRLPSAIRENYLLSPFHREEYWWHVGQSITEQLKAHAMSHTIEDLK